MSDQSQEDKSRAGDREKLEMFTDNILGASNNSIGLVPPELRNAVGSIIADALNEIHNLI